MATNSKPHESKITKIRETRFKFTVITMFASSILLGLIVSIFYKNSSYVRKGSFEDIFFDVVSAETKKLKAQFDVFYETSHVSNASRTDETALCTLMYTGKATGVVNIAITMKKNTNDQKVLINDLSDMDGRRINIAKAFSDRYSKEGYETDIVVGPMTDSVESVLK